MKFPKMFALVKFIVGNTITRRVNPELISRTYIFTRVSCMEREMFRFFSVLIYTRLLLWPGTKELLSRI
jgi:hypothetical protein